MPTESRTVKGQPAASAGKSSSPSARRRSGWRVPIVLLLVGGVVVGTGIAIYVLNRPARGAHTATPTADSKPSKAVPVEVVHPKPGGIERDSEMTGSVHAFESADLFAKVSGYLKTQEVVRDGDSVLVDIGLQVKKGELLAEIDAPELVAAVEQAEADREEAKARTAQSAAQLETAKAEKLTTVNAVTQAEAEVGRYTAQQEETHKAYERYSRLRQLSAVNQDVVDQREDAYESAKANESAARAGVLTAKAKVTAAEAKIQESEADLKAAQANEKVAAAKLQTARVMVSYTKIISPYDGIVTLRSFHRGAFIRGAGEGTTTPLLTVARTDVVRVVTKVSDVDVTYVDVGDSAVVTLDALPGKKFQGKVARFSAVEVPNERTMRTEVDLNNDSGKLREGMYGLVKIILQPPSDELTIPSACLASGSKGEDHFVYVNHDGKARKTVVTTGTDNGVRIEILKGLTKHDEVVQPNSSVSDGTPIRVVTSATSPKNH